MNKLKDIIAKDLWVVVLDLIAFNLSYYLAFYFRFYVNLKLGLENAEKYRDAFLGFAPFYSIISIIIFAAWKLYGGLWRYAGVNDMNRIIMANVCTVVVYVAGTAAFFVRMPVAYYAVGGILQFVFIVIIRFCYRALMVEKKKLRSRGLAKINTIVVGSGEDGRRVVKNLEETDSYRPIAVVGLGAGTMDGVPIMTLEQADWNDVGAVFIADPLLPSTTRAEIKKQTDEVGAELHDYTGYFSNLGGKLSVTELLAVIHSPLILSIDGTEKEYKNGTEALATLTDKYEIEKISTEGKLIIQLEKAKRMSTQDVLAQAYAAVMDGDQK